jgi:excisionase family DNA binding protein
VKQHEQDRLMKIEEAAAYLGLTPGTLYHLVSQRRIPVVRLSKRCLRFKKSKLDKLIETKSFPAE